MLSLPTSTQLIDARRDRGPAPIPLSNTGAFGSKDELVLERAFRSFARTARTLESTYAQLQREVNRLRRELAESDSDRARSASENRRMRVFLDRVLEGLPCGVLVEDAEGRFARVNPEAVRLLGAADLNPPPDSISALSLEMRALLQGAREHSGSEQEANLIAEDGSTHWVVARHAWLTEACGKTSIFILRDTTERRRLDEMRDRAGRDKALAEISAILAHEIRNPLGSLELFAGLLAETSLDTEPQRWVQHIQAGLRTLGATVNNVLHFHSLPETKRTAIQVAQLLEWSRDFCSPVAMQSGITLIIRDCAPGLTLLADRHRLEQVLLNLVLNAIRAMATGGRIELGCSKVPGQSLMEITVADSGPGISPDDLPHIFDAGFTRRADSPGLGLAVCRKIIEQHGGAISVGSEPGHGATFRLQFPVETETNDDGAVKGLQV